MNGPVLAVACGWDQASSAAIRVVSELGLKPYALLLLVVAALVFGWYRWTIVLAARARASAGDGA